MCHAGPTPPGITGFLVSRWQDLPVPPVPPEHHADAAVTAACFGDFYFWHIFGWVFLCQLDVQKSGTLSQSAILLQA